MIDGGRALTGRILALALMCSPLYAGEEVALPAGVEAFNHAMERATSAMDDRAILALWEPDGVSLVAGAAIARGRDAVGTAMSSAMQGLKGARMTHFELQCHLIARAARLASEWCIEHQVVHLAGGRPDFDGRGRIVWVLRRDRDGQWRIASEMWSADSG